MRGRRSPGHRGGIAAFSQSRHGLIPILACPFRGVRISQGYTFAKTPCWMTGRCWDSPSIITAASWPRDLEAETRKRLRFSRYLCLAWPTIHRLHHRALSPRRIGLLLRTALAEVIVDDPTTVTKPSARYVLLSELSVGPARTAYAPVRVGVDGVVNAVGAGAE